MHSKQQQKTSKKSFGVQLSPLNVFNKNVQSSMSTAPFYTAMQLLFPSTISICSCMSSVDQKKSRIQKHNLKKKKIKGNCTALKLIFFPHLKSRTKDLEISTVNSQQSTVWFGQVPNVIEARLGKRVKVIDVQVISSSES